MRGFLNKLAVILMLAMSTSPALAYGFERSPDGKGYLRWRSENISIGVSTSLDSAQNIKTREDPGSIIRRGLLRWQSDAGIRFLFGKTRANASSVRDGRAGFSSLVTVARTPRHILLFSGKYLDRPAVTRLFFDPAGRIRGAEIVLNPFFLFSDDNVPGSFDLEATIVHEAGHLLGLGHSMVLGAVMKAKTPRNGLFSLPATSSRDLSEDDRAAVRALYSYAPDRICCGSVSGRRADSRNKIRGRYEVWAEEAGTGRVAAGIISRGDGSFELAGLRFGRYRLFARQAAASGVMYLGTVRVNGKKGGEITISSKPLKPAHYLRFSGLNGQLAMTSVPLNAGAAYTVYVGGSGFESGTDRPAIEISSPFFKIDQQTVFRQEYRQVDVFSFVVRVADKTPLGNYTIRLVDVNGRVTALVGAITVSDAPNPWITGSSF